MTDFNRFLEWAKRKNHFYQGGPSMRVANYLLARAALGGYDSEIGLLHDGTKITAGLSIYDIQSLFRLANNAAWQEYLISVEWKDEEQSRVDNARGKSY
jgi:hypothetical protein